MSDTSSLASNGSRMLKKKEACTLYFIQKSTQFIFYSKEHVIYILFKRARIYILFLKKSVHDNFYWPGFFKLAVASAREPRDLAWGATRRGKRGESSKG